MSKTSKYELLNNLSIYTAADAKKSKVLDLIAAYGCQATLGQVLTLLNTELDSIESKILEQHAPEDIKNMSHKDVELLQIHSALRECNGNITAAADKIGLGRATFYRKLHKEKQQRGRK
jgi:transcriptional regulator of acetoin/glycerol metabolism